MNKIQFFKLACVVGALSMSSCNLDPLDDDLNKEMYTRNFLKTFGMIDSRQDWNMATDAVVSINVGDKTVSSLKIYGKQGSKYYLVADLNDIQGKVDVPVDVPKTCQDVLIKADGRKYYGSIGSLIDLTSMSRADMENITNYDPWDNENLDLPSFTADYDTGYSLSRKHTKCGKNDGSYQYFNTQQMSPIIISEGEEWERYYSLNQGKWVENSDHEDGLLPECGIFKRTKEQITNHINAKRAAGHTMTYDFTLTVENGSFTFFPYYYGSNFTHDLGVYLLDRNGTPILKNGGTYDSSRAYDPLTDFVTFKIFEDRQTGDLQTQPHYFNDFNSDKISYIKVKAKKLIVDGTSGEVTYEYLNGGDYFEDGDRIEITVGDKIQFEVEAYDASNNLLFTNTSSESQQATFFSKYHTRFAYHVWDHKKNHSIEPVTFAEIDRDGLLTAVRKTTDLIDTEENYANGFGFMDIGVGAKILNGSVSGYNGVTSVSGPGIGLEIAVNPVGAVTSMIDNIGLDLTLNNDPRLTWEYCDTYDNIRLYVPLGETGIVLPVACSKNGRSVALADVIDKILIDDASWSNSFHVYKEDGLIKVDPIAVNGEVWANLYYDKNGNERIDETTDTPKKGFQIKVYDPASVSVEHKHTQSYSEPWSTSTTTIPSTIASSWHSYFNAPNGGAQPGDGGTDRFSAPRRASGSETVIWPYTGGPSWPSENYKNFELTDVSKWPSDLSSYTAINIEYSAVNSGNDTKLHLWFGNWGNNIEISWMTVNESPYSITLTDEYKNKILSGGIILQGENVTVTKVSLVSGSGSGGGSSTSIWADGGQDQAKTDIATYYASNLPTGIACDDHDGFTNFAGSTVTVTFPKQATYDNIAYTVTWKKTVIGETRPGNPTSSWSASAPRRNGKASSRDDGKPSLLEEGYEGATWKDVNAAWSKYLPLGEEVSSYPHRLPMLGRTRGYDIFIKYQGLPFNGKVGMYLTTKKLIELTSSEQISLKDLDRSISEDGSSYTLYSQSKYNRAKDGRLSDQIAAITFKHPASGRTFFGFEDRRVAHTGSSFSAWDDSSDRDLNDMIFLLSNYDAVEGVGDIITEDDEIVESGFPWIWAVEDLGSTDDFDFNDLVVKIHSVTKSNKHTVTQGESTTTTYTMLYKKVTFTPLAAGGTLPLYINLKVGDDVYVLRPGTFNLNATSILDKDGTDITATIPLASGLIDNFNESEAEVHKWFGNYSFKTIINTGYSVNGVNASSCVIYVAAPSINASTGEVGSDGFRINIFSGGTGGSVVDNYDVVNDSRVTTYFYITVDRNSDQSSIYADRDAYSSILNHGLGGAPQSFIIQAPLNQKDLNWRWPSERKHILLGYPDFGEWVHDHTKTQWLNNSVPTYLY